MYLLTDLCFIPLIRIHIMACATQKGSVSSDSKTVQPSLTSTTVQPKMDMQKSQHIHDSERLPLQSLADSTDTSTTQHQPTSSATGKQIKSGK